MEAAGLESPYAEWIKRWEDRGERTITTRVRVRRRTSPSATRRCSRTPPRSTPTARWFTVPLDMQREIWPTEDYEAALSYVPDQPRSRTTCSPGWAPAEEADRARRRSRRPLPDRATTGTDRARRVRTTRLSEPAVGPGRAEVPTAAVPIRDGPGGRGVPTIGAGGGPELPRETWRCPSWPVRSSTSRSPPTTRSGRRFYREAFGWGVDPMPDMSYAMLRTVPVDGQGRPVEPGAINGGMLRRQSVWQRRWSSSTSRTSTRPWPRSSASAVPPCGRTPVGEMGFTAYFTDTEGNLMGLWQTAPG